MLPKPSRSVSHVGAKASLCTADRRNILKMFRLGCHLQSKIVDIAILIIFSKIYFKREASKSVLPFSKLVVNFKADLWPLQLPGLLGGYRHVCEHKGVPHLRYLWSHHIDLTNESMEILLSASRLLSEAAAESYLSKGKVSILLSHLHQGSRNQQRLQKHRSLIEPGPCIVQVKSPPHLGLDQVPLLRRGRCCPQLPKYASAA